MNGKMHNPHNSNSQRDSRNFLTNLFMMIKTSQLYHPNNNAFISALKGLRQSLDILLDQTSAVNVEVIENDIFLNEEKVKSDLYTYSSMTFLRETFAEKFIGGLTFSGPGGEEQLTAFFTLFAKYQPPAESAKDSHTLLNEKIDAADIDDVQALKQSERKLSTVNERTVMTNKASAVRNYIRAIEVVKDGFSQVDDVKKGGPKGLNLRKAKRVIYNLVNHSFDEGYSFVSLSAIKNFDAYTFNHCVNVCVIAIAFGQNLGLSKKQLTDLGVSALYHDIGKIDIPKNILNKPTSFSDDEWHIMKQHPVLAIKHLLPMDSPADMDVLKVVPAFEHHRDYDLTGYPPIIIRKPLNIYSKIVAIADTYDALTSSRVYQNGLLPNEALQVILKGAGKKFDPVLAKAFINTMGIYPVGSLVKLSNGDLAIVSEANKDPHFVDRPKVTIIVPKSGVMPKQLLIDLADDQFQNVGIAKAMNSEEQKVNVAHHLLGM